MFCFEVLGIFGEKSQKRKEKNMGTSGSYAAAWVRRSVGNPRRGIDLCRRVGCLTTARPRCQFGIAWVCHGISFLHYGVDTVHSEKVFGFLFRTPHIRTPIFLEP